MMTLLCNCDLIEPISSIYNLQTHIGLNQIDMQIVKEINCHAAGFDKYNIDADAKGAKLIKSFPYF